MDPNATVIAVGGPYGARRSCFPLNWPAPHGGAFLCANAGCHALVNPLEVISFTTSPPHGSAHDFVSSITLARGGRRSPRASRSDKDSGVQREMILMAARYMAMVERVAPHSDVHRRVSSWLRQPMQPLFRSLVERPPNSYTAADQSSLGGRSMRAKNASTRTSTSGLTSRSARGASARASCWRR